MGLLRMAARTAVVAGTATAVSGRVARRQAARYDQQDAQQYAQEPQQYAPEPPVEEDDSTAQLQKLAAGAEARRTHIAASPRSVAIRTRLKPSTTTIRVASTAVATSTGLRIPMRSIDARTRASSSGATRRKLAKR